jgi:hypothetical protein
VSGVFEFAPALSFYRGRAHNPKTLRGNFETDPLKLNWLSESPDVVRARWEARVALDAREVRARKFAVWAVLPSLVALLIVSARSIWAHVSRTSERSHKAVVFAAGAQLLVFIVGSTALRAWWGLDLIALLAPITLLLWTGELGAAVWFNKRRRSAA